MFDADSRLGKRTRLFRFIRIGLTTAALMSAIPVSSFAVGQGPDDPPRSSRLRGREIPADLAPFSADVRAELARTQSDDDKSRNLGQAALREFSMLKDSPGAPSVAPVTTFRQMVSGVPVAGSLRVVKPFKPVSSEYVKTVEQIMRLHLSLPIFARTMTSTSTVIFSFTVRNDGSIADVEKEQTTGSPALDNVVKSLLTSISPLEPPRNLGLVDGQEVQPLVRLRFTLTYRPSA